MKKDVLFLCQFFYPEHNSSATLPFDTASYLVQKGLHVDAICGYPYEYRYVDPPATEENVNGIHIKRLRYLQLPRNKKIGRLINFFSFTGNVLLHIAEIRHYKTIVVYSNPPILPLVAVIANALFRTKIVYISYDVYPEVAYASGAIQKGSLIDRVMHWLNQQLFRRAEKVIALTDEMREFLLENRNIENPNKITVIPNWAHEENDLRKKSDRLCKRKDIFQVSYLGNMGTCQDMETLLDAIDVLKCRPNIHFLLAGHGNKLETVKKRTAENPQVEIRDFLLEDDFMEALASSSCCIVSLERGLKGMCAPSKYYSYLYGGKPVIAIVDKDTYLFREIREQQLGKAVEIGSVDDLVTAITDLAETADLGRMGENAEFVYQSMYCKALGLEKYRVLLADILASSV